MIIFARNLSNGINKYSLAPLKLQFNEPLIPFKFIKDSKGGGITEHALGLWKQRRITDRNMGDINDRVNGRHSNFNTLIVHDNEVLGTLCSQNNNILYSAPIYMSDNERLLGATFQADYDTGGRQLFLTGMCVPPVMTAQISYQIYLQWLSKIK